MTKYQYIFLPDQTMDAKNNSSSTPYHVMGEEGDIVPLPVHICLATLITTPNLLVIFIYLSIKKRYLYIQKFKTIYPAG